MLALPEELLDRGGSGHGPLALEPDDYCLVLGVDEVGFDEAARQQRPADERHEDDDVLAEQPAPTCRQHALDWRAGLLGHGPV